MINTDYIIKWSELDLLLESNLDKEVAITYIPTDSHNDIFISNTKEQYRSFLIEYENNVIKNYIPPKVNGVDISIKQVPSINNNKTYLCVKNTNLEWDDAFIGFSIAVFDCIDGTKTDGESIDAFESAVRRYHEFFKYRNNISKEEEQGLVAELLFLSEEIEKRGPEAVIGWYGAEKNKRDFIFDEYSVEVKSTKNQKQDIIIVSNENQLDRGESNLKLRLYIFDENSSGCTLKQCIDNIINSLCEYQYLKLFRIKMSLLGISIDDIESNNKYCVEKIKTYQVDESFPCIVKSNIPTNAFDVSYKLNLSNIPYIENEGKNDRQ